MPEIKIIVHREGEALESTQKAEERSAPEMVEEKAPVEEAPVAEETPVEEAAEVEAPATDEE